MFLCIHLQASTVENMDSEHVDEVERNLSSHVHKEKEEMKDEKTELSDAENVKNESKETSATTDAPAGLGLKGLQPLPLRVSVVCNSILLCRIHYVFLKRTNPKTEFEKIGSFTAQFPRCRYISAES